MFPRGQVELLRGIDADVEFLGLRVQISSALIAVAKLLPINTSGSNA